MKRFLVATLAIGLAFGAGAAFAGTIWDFLMKHTTGAANAPARPPTSAMSPARATGGITADPQTLLGACRNWLKMNAPKADKASLTVAQRLGEAACQSYIHGFFGGSIASGKRSCPTTKYKNDHEEMAALVSFLDGWSKRAKPFTDKGVKFNSGTMLGLFVYEGVLCDEAAKN